MKIDGVEVNMDWNSWWTAVKDWASRYNADPHLLYAAAVAEDRGLTNREVQQMMRETHHLHIIQAHRNILTEQMKPGNCKTVCMGTRLAPIDGVQEIFLGNASESYLQF